eukprot:m.142890 g.142890  ORF g.142890 m.142890 type:complete len:494 (+) comp14072_c2_seq4:66-1547(+)
MALAEEEDIRYLPAFRAPIARQLPGEKPGRRPLVPAYLVLDLTIARALANLGQNFESVTNAQQNGGVGGATRVFLLLFFPIFFQWLRTQHFVNRFDAEDGVFVLHFIFNLILMGFTGSNIGACARVHSEDQDRCVQFTGCLAALRLVHVGFEIYVSFFNKQFKKFMLRQMIPNMIVTLLWFITSVVRNEQAADVLWIATICFEMIVFIGPHFVPQLRLTSAEIIPLHPDLLASRHNRFSIIALAYVLSGALASTNAVREFMTYCEGIIIACACLVVAGLKLQYFDLQDVTRPSDTDKYGSRHPVTRRAPHERFRVVWELLHFPLNMCVVLVGGIFKFFLTEENAAPGSCKTQSLPIHKHILAIPLALAALITLAQQLLSSGGIGGFRKRIVRKSYRITIRIAVAALIIAMPTIMADSKRSVYVFVVTFLFLGGVVFDLIARLPSKQRHDLDDGNSVFHPISDETALVYQPPSEVQVDQSTSYAEAAPETATES